MKEKAVEEMITITKSVKVSLEKDTKEEKPQQQEKVKEKAEEEGVVRRKWVTKARKNPRRKT